MKQLILVILFIFPAFVIHAQEPEHAFELKRKFSSIAGFSEGLAAVKSYEAPYGWGFMDATGKMVIPAQFNDVTPFREGKAVVVTQQGDLVVIKRPRNK